MNWLLPEYLADALPAEAARIETLRRIETSGVSIRWNRLSSCE